MLNCDSENGMSNFGSLQFTQYAQYNTTEIKGFSKSRRHKLFEVTIKWIDCDTWKDSIILVALNYKINLAEI